MLNFAKPLIPGGLLHTMYDVQSSVEFNQDKGGQYEHTGTKRIPFQGVVLPISNVDLQYAPQGTFTENSEKVYTNGYELSVGAQVNDPQSGITYTVKQELGHNSIHPMRRYVVEYKGKSAPR